MKRFWTVLLCTLVLSLTIIACDNQKKAQEEIPACTEQVDSTVIVCDSTVVGVQKDTLIVE